MKRFTRLAAGSIAVLAALALASCGGGDDPLADQQSGDTSTGAGSAEVVVGSANFPENQLLAEMYAGALKSAGVNVTTRLNIGSREVYLGALQDASIGVIPEYTGNLAKYVDNNADISDAAKAAESLRAALPEGLVALEPSQAENKDSVVVTAETAQAEGLKSVEDLQGKAADMVLGGPPEWAERPDGVKGLERVYGLTFKEFRPLDATGTLAVTSLKNGQVDAVNLFSTDPQIAANNFVVLEDTKNLFGAQQVVPVVRQDVADNQQAADALNKVSAALTTEGLTDEVAKVVIDKRDAAEVADEWLAANGF